DKLEKEDQIVSTRRHERLLEAADTNLSSEAITRRNKCRLCNNIGHSRNTCHFNSNSIIRGKSW
ncbi:6509_t:CDS:1, partial [Entrophospora sp. SA101]